MPRHGRQKRRVRGGRSAGYRSADLHEQWSGDDRAGESSLRAAERAVHLTAATRIMFAAPQGYSLVSLLVPAEDAAASELER